MDKYKKICLYFRVQYLSPSPPGVGPTGSSGFHQEAPEQSKSTAQIPVQNQKGTAERARTERQLGR